MMKMKKRTSFSYHAFIYENYVSIFSDSMFLPLICYASVSLTCEVEARDVGALLLNAIDVDKQVNYRAWQTL